MTAPTSHRIHNNVAFGFLSLIDVDKIRQSVTDDWFNQTLCEVNDCVVSLGVVQGEFHWHKHCGLLTWRSLTPMLGHD